MNDNRLLPLICLLFAFLTCLFAVPARGLMDMPAVAHQQQAEPGSDTLIEPNGQVGGRTSGLAARGNYVYLGVGPRLVVLDLSNIELFDEYDDFRIGQTEPFPGVVQDVVIEGNYAYVAAGKAGLRVIDISDPTLPREVGALVTVENAYTIDVQESLVYLGDYGPSGLHVIDVRDPSSPQELGVAEWSAGIWSISVVGDYAYVADGYDFFIFDVSDPTAPQQIGHVGTGCSALDVAVSGNYAYVADHDNCGLLIANVSDPTINTFVVMAEPDEAFYVNSKLPGRDQRTFLSQIEIVGNYAYVVNHEYLSAFNAYLTIFDISDPTMPDPIAHKELHENRPYSEITDLVIDGNFAYLSHADGGVYVADLTKLRVANIVTPYRVFGPVVGVVADRGKVTAAAPRTLHRGFEGGLDRSYSFLAQTFEARATNWVGNNGIGYLTAEKGLIALDLHGMSDLLGPMPQEFGRMEAPERPFLTATDGAQAFLFHQQGSLLHIVDATNPNSSHEIGVVSVPDTFSSTPRRAIVGNNIAFLFYWDSPPWMIDLRGQTPEPLGFLGHQPVGDLAVIDDKAYAAAGEAGVLRYDMTDPASPHQLAPLAGVTAALAISNDGPYLFVAGADEVLHIFDTTTEEPSPVGVLHAPYEFKGAAVLDGRVFVAAGDSGLWSYSVPGIVEPEAAGQSDLVFDNFPLSEAILVYIDEGGDLVMENVDTGAMARLTVSGDVNYYSIARTRDRILYTNWQRRPFVIAFEFRSDGLLIAKPLPDTLPRQVTEIRWAPGGARVVLKDVNFRWWIFDVSGSASPIPLPAGTHTVGGWSHDGQWLNYCTADGTLEIIDWLGQTSVVDQDIECDRIMGGEWPKWSPKTPLLAYARGLAHQGLRPVIYNAATGEHFEMPANHWIDGWSPDGRYLAVSENWSASGQEVVESITIVNDRGGVIEQLPGYTREIIGEVGWVRATEEEAIFGRYELGDEPGDSRPLADALFGISDDGDTRWWGLVDDASVAVLCSAGGDDHEVYQSFNPIYPDESHPQESPRYQGGIYVLSAPDGNSAVIDAYAEGEEWRRMLVRCTGGEPLVDIQVDLPGLYAVKYSADGRRVLWDTHGPVLAYNAENGGELRRNPESVRQTPAWLITSDAAPPITQINVIAGQVTDHTGAPLPGARVLAGDLTTTTDDDGRYRFDNLEDGGYTVAVELTGYIFAAPQRVTVPPVQMGIDFQAEPPSGYAITGRVTDCQGDPVRGVEVRYDLNDGRVTTDADGRYSFAGLERKSYTLTAAADGYGFVPATRTVRLERYAAGETLAVDFVATTPERDEFCIPHLEIIQVVQDEFNSAPIIADKPALLRAYLHCPGCDPNGKITGTLEAFRVDDGTAIPVRDTPLTARMSKPSDGTFWPTHRGDLDRSLNFLLPPEWLEEGDVRFRVSANGAAATLDVDFEPGKPLRIYYVPLSYSSSSAPVIPEPVPVPPRPPGVPPPEHPIFEAGRDALVTLLPISRDDLVYIPQSARTQYVNVPFNQDGEPRMNAQRYLDVLNAYWLRMEQTDGWRDGQAPDRLVGWVMNIDEHIGASGIADIRFEGDGDGVVTAVARSSEGNLEQILGIYKFPDAGYALVHELGHILNDNGLKHTPFERGSQGCLEVDPGETETAYPLFDPLGSIGDPGIYFYGSSYELIPRIAYDIMAYCGPNWVSVYNYKRFHDGFVRFDDVLDEARAAALEPRLLISGRVLSSTQTAEFDPLYQIQAVAPPTPDAPGDYCIELRDAADAPLNSRCFNLTFREGITGSITDAGAFNLAMPWVEGAASSVVTHAGRELGRVTASPAPPVVAGGSVVAELSNDGETVTLRWSGDDADGDALAYTIGLIGDRGYIPLAFNIREETYAIDALSLPGDEPLRVVVEASDGFHSVRAESAVPLVLPTKPPQVAIITPPDESMSAGQPFWLFGSASDVEDGMLGGDALVWSVDDEELGRGSQLFATLPEGEYSITLEATDSDGEWSSAELTVIVASTSEEDAPNDATDEIHTLRRWLGWIAAGSGIVLLAGLFLLFRDRRRGSGQI